jgi:hypothetical protein
MNGYGEFKYFAEFPSFERDRFCKYRIWCWEQWGPSCEFQLWPKVTDPNPAWCWNNIDYNTRIYFREDSQYSWFLLTWGS